MKYCLETSSLIPLVVATPYTRRLFRYIKENSLEYQDFYIFRDCIAEASSARFLQIENYECLLGEQTHNDFKMSIIRKINESFTAQNIQHNYARGCTIFVLDVMDKINSFENYSDFKMSVYSKVNDKIKRIKTNFLDPNLDELYISPDTLEYYWWIDSDVKMKYNVDLTIEILDDNIDITTKYNKDRDIAHFNQFINYQFPDGDTFNEMFVCDAGFKNQLKNLYTIGEIRKVRHFNKRK